MNQEIKVVIPARFSSSRLPGKPLLELAGKPMFWHVAQRVIEAGVSIKDVVIATDDQRILDSAESVGVPAILTDAAHLSGTDRLNEVAELMKWSDETFVVNVQGDEPLIPSDLIRKLIDFAKKSEQFDICTAICPLHSENDKANPNIVKVAMGENGRAVYFSRSPIPFNRDTPSSLENVYRHIGIYTYKVDTLRKFCSYPESILERWEKLEQLRALSNGFNIGATVVDSAPPHGVDTEQDYQNIKFHMEN